MKYSAETEDFKITLEMKTFEPTWRSILKAFFDILKAVGFVFNNKVEETITNLYEEEI